MKVRRTSVISGKDNTLDLDITNEQLASFLLDGKLVQDAFPNLSAEHREFILTGITPEEWNATFKDEEDI